MCPTVSARRSGKLAATMALDISRDLQFGSRLRELVETNLRDFAVHAAGPGAHRTAAVAVAITEEGTGADLPGIAAPPRWSTRAALILTRRAAGLGNHPGQWALPGGRVDPGESPEQAALREMAEEVGLLLDPCAVLGRLDDFTSRSGFVITPVVVWAGRAAELTPNPAEVASIHRIPISEFLRADAPLLETLEGSEHPVLRMPVGERAIAAPTAAVLYQFREVCLFGRPTRVAHFEQPLFARK
jgi:8-oxo-dGTP pyrophosphatase MutT (NUDIX family)